jgi:hypothetical protein
MKEKDTSEEKKRQPAIEAPKTGNNELNVD